MIVIGIAFDFAWQQFNQESISPDEQSTLNIMTSQLNMLSKKSLHKHIKTTNQQFKGSFKLLNEDSSHAKSILISLLENDNKQPFIYMQSESDNLSFSLIEQHQLVLQLTTQRIKTKSSIKILLISLFYGLLAVAIFFWVNPLSKDLNRLEKAVNQFDQQQWQSKVDLPNTSSIFHLARAYNQLLDKIKILIETQQAMSHSISHELRTPLARIRFSLQMAEESNDINFIKNQVKSIDDDINEMNQLINELLNYASLENSSIVANIEKGDIKTLLETLILRLKNNFPEQSIQLKINTNHSIVSCDSYLMERALQNLIINACKFCKNTVLVSLEENEQQFKISIEDDGQGVKKELRDKIFSSFVQIKKQSHSSEQVNHKGFGLGLAIVKRVMALHFGSVRVESSLLGGAKFILCWPSINRTSD